MQPTRRLAFESLEPRKMFAVDLATLRLNNDTGSFGNDHYTSDAALVGTVSGASTVEFDVDGNGQFGDSADGTASVVDGAFSFTPLLDDGTYTIVARAKVNDGYGGTFSDTKSLTFTLDRTPPSTTLVLYDDTGVSSSDRLTNDDRFTGTVDDASPATVRVLVDLDNAGTFAHSATVSGGTWSFDPSLSDGAHTIRVKSIDLAGNEFTTLPLSFQLDTKAPSVTEMNPVNGAELAAAPTVVNFTFDEAIDPASITAQAMQLLAEVGPKPVQQGSHPTSNMATITITGTLPPGKYTSQISDILDLAGNTQQSAASASWTVSAPSNSPPTANPDTAQTNVDQPVEIDVLINDSDSDGTLAPSSVTITTGAQFGNTTIDSSTGKVTYAPAAGFSGVDTFYYTVADNSGQVSQPAQVTVNVAPEQTPVRVLFLNAQSKQVQKLEVSKWLTAFTPAFNANFIDNDPDSFRVVVIDHGREGAGKIVVKLSTKNEQDFAAYNDDATEIELIESTQAPGQFFSKRMILVSDNVDDDSNSEDTVLPLATPKDDTLNDRTHLIALGGKVIVEYEGADEPAKARVPVEKVVNIHATVLINKQGKVLIGEPYIDSRGERWENDADIEKAEGNYRDIDGLGTWTETLTQAQAKERVEHDLKVINERYAQLGVRFVLSSVDFKHIPGLNNGIVRVSGEAGATGYNELTPDEQALADANFRTADPNDIELVYVHGIRRGDTATSGRAFTSDYYRNMTAQDFNDIILLPNQAKYFTAAHEVLHLLRQDKDHPPRSVERTLLSAAGSDIAVESKSTIGGPKRITRPYAKQALEGPYLSQAGAAPQASRSSAPPAGTSASVAIVSNLANVSGGINGATSAPAVSISAQDLASLSMEELASLEIEILSVDDWADLGLKGML